MKVLLGILLALNVIMFVVMRGNLLSDDEINLVQPELNREKIRLVSDPTEQIASAVSAVVVSENVESSALTCMEWSDFSGADLKRANEALAGLSLGEKLSQRPIEYSSGYWVYIPPIHDKASINQKIAQLKARGIEEYFVVQEAGEFQHAISLGIFKSEDAAQKFLGSLTAKNVHSAKMGERASKLKAVAFVFNKIDAQMVEKLGMLRKYFPTSEFKKLTCQ